MLALIGVLMLGFGNTAIIYECQLYLSSGLTALLVATIPLYERYRDVSSQRWGASGTRLGGRVDWILRARLSGVAGLLHEQPAWGLASDDRDRGCSLWLVVLDGGVGDLAAGGVRVSGLASAAWQMLFGGIFITVMMFASRGRYHGTKWGAQAWNATLYLVVFGSLVGYSA